jgi:GT2 family glycosyltransferase
LSIYPEVACEVGQGKKAGSLLEHFLRFGINENKSPLPDFDIDFYLKEYADINEAYRSGSILPVHHWLFTGAKENRNPNKYFNSLYYLEKNPEVTKEMAVHKMQSPFEHFLWLGRKRGLKANPPLVELHAEEDAGKIIFARKAELIADNIIFSGGLSLNTSLKPEITFVIPVFNEINFTLQILAELDAKVRDPFEVIVVDDASTDQTSSLERLVSGIKVIHLEKNVGFPSACNIGWREASAPVVAFLNNDIEIGHGAVRFALETLNSEEKAGAVGGRIVRTHGKLQEAGCIVWNDGSVLGYGRDRSPVDPEFNQKKDVDYCSACFLVVKHSLLQLLNGFDEAFAPGYYEETELCARIWENGYRVILDPRIYIHHFEYASFSKARPPTVSFALISKHRKEFVNRRRGFLESQKAPALEYAFAASDRRNKNKQSILLIEDLIPLSRLGSGFGRTNQIVQSLLGHGFAVTVLVQSRREEATKHEILQYLNGVELIYADSPNEINIFLQNRYAEFHAIWVCRTHTISKVRGVLQSILTKQQRPTLILDTEAIASNRGYALSSILGSSEWSTAHFHKMVADELAGAELFDDVILVNVAEKKLVDEVIPLKKTSVLRLSLEKQVATSSNKAIWKKRSGFLFVGAVFDATSPNYDSLLWFVDSVWPMILAEMPTATLSIAGHWDKKMEDKVSQIKKAQNIIFLGAVPNLEDQYAQHRVFVAPTRFAAGVPVKVQESLSYGLPAVVTPLLARQLGWNNGEGILFDDNGGCSAPIFAQACIHLYSNFELWKSTVDEGLEAIGRDCSPNAFDDQVLRIVQNTLSAK